MNGLKAKEITSSSAEAAPDGTRLYQYSLWDKEMRKHRGKIWPLIGLPLIYTSILMWTCLSLFWGSLVGNNDLGRLTVALVNLDHGFVGEAIVAGVKASTIRDVNHLDWRFVDSLHQESQSRDLVLDEAVWAVLRVSPNASSTLTAALRDGNASYSPLSAITVFFASARQQITVNSHVVPGILGTINPILAEIAVNHTADYLRSIAINETLLNPALRCPQCLASPFVIDSADLVLYDSTVANGPTMTGLIFLLTFTFSIFQILRNAGIILGNQMKLASALLFRAVASLSAYLIMALWYSLINLAFRVPLDTKFGHAGFVVFWMLSTCTMAAVGLPMESLFTLIGLKWAGYFLSLWIIVNVSGSFNSFEIMPRFYQYGYAFPFHHSIQGARTIVFGTKSHLGLNFGVLLAWMMAGLFGMYALTAWRVRKNSKIGSHIVL